MKYSHTISIKDIIRIIARSNPKPGKIDATKDAKRKLKKLAI